MKMKPRKHTTCFSPHIKSGYKATSRKAKIALFFVLKMLIFFRNGSPWFEMRTKLFSLNRWFESPTLRN